MRITTIEMSLAAVIPHPTVSYANAQPSMTVTGIVQEGEDPTVARTELKAFLTEGFLEIAKEAFLRMQPKKAK
jgi:hypothetical protein